MRVSYEELTDGVEPDCQTVTKLNIETTWVFDDYYIVQNVNKETGQLLWSKKPRKGAKIVNSGLKTSNYYMVFKPIGEARSSGKLTFNEAALLHALIENIEWEDNYVYNEIGERMSVRQFSKYIGKDKKWTLTHLKQLDDKGFIRLETSKRGSWIYVNPQYAWRGHIKTKGGTTWLRKERRG